MKAIHTVGLDIAKAVLQVHAVSESGEVVLKRRLATKDVTCFFEELPPCLIGMEAGGGANYLAQKLAAIGHTVKVMPASYVKPYVKTNKNDSNDAEAICEAVRRPNMRFVPVKCPEQQAILNLHRTRALLSRQKVSLTTSLKAALAEFGIAVAKNSPGTRDALRFIDNSKEKSLPRLARASLKLLVAHLNVTEARIRECQKLIDAIHKKTKPCLRLATVPGIGPLAATALVAIVGDGTTFRSGREMAAWLGLVPRQHSSGGRQALGGISKRGDSYLRRLLVIGAMSLMNRGRKSKYRMVHWALSLAACKHYKIAAIALANKIARIAWAVLAKGKPFRECPQ
jgi:transposase